MSFKTLALVATAATATLMSGLGPAQAKHKWHGFGIHHGPRVHLFIGGGGGGCGYYYDMWQDTGRLYWKRRYYQCRGWW